MSEKTRDEMERDLLARGWVEVPDGGPGCYQKPLSEDVIERMLQASKDSPRLLTGGWWRWL